MIKKSLFSLAVGGFGIGMTEFVIMGLLPDVAQDLSISIPKAGYLISIYALGVVVGAPLLAGLTGRFPPKKILLGLAIIFTIFNFLSAVAPTFELLLLARFFSGLPHGAFFGVGAVVASRLAENGKVASAVATMFAGLTLANVFGVPLGTYVGHMFNWRLSFLIVAFIGLLTFLSIRLWIPVFEGNKTSNIKNDFVIFKKPELWFAIFITSIGTGGFFAWFSYIAPLLIEVSMFSSDSIPLIMTVAGLGMTFGNIIGGIAADKFSPTKAIILLMFTMSFLLCLNGLFASSQVAMVILTFLTGTMAMSLGSPIQVLLIENTKEAEMLGASLGQTSFNIGNALGAYLGGIPLVLGYSLTSPQWVGALMAVVGACIAICLSRRTHH